MALSRLGMPLRDRHIGSALESFAVLSVVAIGFVLKSLAAQGC
jgi:hypothetical protein